MSTVPEQIEAEFASIRQGRFTSTVMDVILDDELEAQGQVVATKPILPQMQEVHPQRRDS